MDRQRLRTLAVLGAFVFVFALGLLGGRATGGSTAEPDAGDELSQADPEPAHLTGSGDAHEKRSEVGFVRDRAGAVEAAASYVTRIDGPAFLDEFERERLLHEFASEAFRDSLSAGLAQAADEVISRLALTSEVTDDEGFVWWSVPVGWQLVRYSPDEAVVAIWGTGVVVVEARQLDQPGWATVEVTLRWERDTWRLAGLRHQPGPTPPLAGAAGAGSVGRQIAAFEPFAHRPIRPVDR